MLTLQPVFSCTVTLKEDTGKKEDGGKQKKATA